MMSICGKSIEIGKVPFNIYNTDKNGVPLLFCRSGYEISPERKLILSDVNRTFYVQGEEMPAYLDYAADRIEEIVKNPSISNNDKVFLVKSVGNRMVHRILKDPKSGPELKRTGNFINSYVALILDIPEVKNDLFEVATMGKYLLSRSFNVCTLCLLLGEVLYNKNKKHLWRLGMGGLLLDLGMTQLGNEILEKPGKLTDDEAARVKQHPEFSYNMLKGHNFPDAVCDMARGHHERMDGSGYPRGLSGTKIHPYALIAGLADTYDAITSDKPYKPMETHVMALEEISSMQEKFNPKVFNALLKVVLIDPKLIEIYRDKFGLSGLKTGRFQI